MSRLLIEALRRAHPAHARTIDVVENSPAIQELFRNADSATVAEREKLAAELARQPKLFAKQIDAAARECADAARALDAARVQLDAARSRHALAAQVPGGLEAAQRQAEEKLRDELRKTASPLITAAHRAVYALCVARFAPAQELVIVRAVDPYDAGALDAQDKAVAGALERNASAGLALLQAEIAQRAAMRALEDLQLVPLAEVDVFERVAAVLAELNTALHALKDHPAIVLDAKGDVSLKFGVDAKVFTIKTAEIGKKESLQ
jgi:hypothetical protein